MHAHTHTNASANAITMLTCLAWNKWATHNQASDGLEWCKELAISGRIPIARWDDTQHHVRPGKSVGRTVMFDLTNKKLHDATGELGASAHIQAGAHSIKTFVLLPYTSGLSAQGRLHQRHALYTVLSSRLCLPIDFWGISRVGILSDPVYQARIPPNQPLAPLGCVIQYDPKRMWRQQGSTTTGITRVRFALQCSVQICAINVLVELLEDDGNVQRLQDHAPIVSGELSAIGGFSRMTHVELC